MKIGTAIGRPSRMSAPPSRKHPVHHPVHERHNRSLIVFVTVCTKDRKSLLANPEAHELLRTVWTGARNWVVGRYVIMPDHIHLFCAPLPLVPEALQPWVGFWK